MGGVDTYRGIAYQHAQAVLSALDVVESDVFTAIRVEGADDVIDIELLDANGRVAVGKQARSGTTGTRGPRPTWLICSTGGRWLTRRPAPRSSS